MAEGDGTWTLDYRNMLAPRVGPAGADPDDLTGILATEHTRALRGLEALRAAGRLGFLSLPDAGESREHIQEVADGFGQWFRTIVVLGIGGSALGTQTLRDALRGPHWNELSDEAREHFPRLYVLDNPDPDTVESLLGRIDLRTTLFNVVSKSGSTAETAALYLVVRSRLAAALEDEDAVRGHLLFTTDPERGALRPLAEADGIPALTVPPDVGGRFSVLSAVGLLPAAVLGLDLEALLGGAADMRERCMDPDLRRNPAGLLATLLHAADRERGQPIHVLMPYADRLRTFGLWFQQLWAESLGKVRADGVSVGPTPLPALGAVDQHAQVQLFMEGPVDKVVLFLGVRRRARAVPIPSVHPDVDEFGYLGGSDLGTLLDAEQRATAEALRRGGRPNLTLTVDRVDERALGGLFMLFEMATVLAGVLYEIDPMVQPGVELGKELTYGLMGRDGYEAPALDEDESPWSWAG